jgi:alginate O-acetyltransferase complex protein AlgI
MPEKKNRSEILYDSTCRFCTDGIGRLLPWLNLRDIEPVPFENGAEESEMVLKWEDGRVFRGAEALIFLGRLFWYSWPIASMAKLPGLNGIAHAAYRFVAKNRHCINGACEIDLSEPKPRVWPGWVLLFGLIAGSAALGFVFEIPAWLWMWILSGALWVSFKFMAFRSEGGFRKVNPLFFGWIGTDADAFRYDRDRTEPEKREVGTPLGFLAIGLALILFLLPNVENTIAIGWVGVCAMLCLFHFGGFAILAGVWRRFGFPVEPIMNAPWAAKSLADFWGPRWNRAFSDWARIHVFRPLVRKFGTARGTFAGFLASGIAHEIVISLPARAGWGLPTIYFIIQAGALLLQRKFRPLRNRFMTLAFVLAPAPILFHPPFIERVFAPMMNLITRN